jgi:hypothetical protein
MLANTTVLRFSQRNENVRNGSRKKYAIHIKNVIPIMILDCFAWLLTYGSARGVHFFARRKSGPRKK